MVYEARQSPKLNYLLAGACLLLSLLGFAAAGVIPTASGSYPLVGWTIASYAVANPLKRAAGALDRGMGFGHFGINTTFYDHGLDELLATVRHYRPDLVEGSDRL